jgi:hypothetical protein
VPQGDQIGESHGVGIGGAGTVDVVVVLDGVLVSAVLVLE